MSYKHKDTGLVIEAIQYTGSNFDNVGLFLGSSTYWQQTEHGVRIINLADQELTIPVNDYIVKHDGKFFRESGRGFEERFDVVDAGN